MVNLSRRRALASRGSQPLELLRQKKTIKHSLAMFAQILNLKSCGLLASGASAKRLALPGKTTAATCRENMQRRQRGIICGHSKRPNGTPHELA